MSSIGGEGEGCGYKMERPQSKKHVNFFAGLLKDRNQHTPFPLERINTESELTLLPDN